MQASKHWFKHKVFRWGGFLLRLARALFSSSYNTSCQSATFTRPRTPQAQPHAGDGEASYYCQMKTLFLKERTQNPRISQEFYSTYSENV
jgi:hypothetical protein